MKTFLITIIGILIGFLIGFNTRCVDTIFRIGRQSVANEITQSLQVTGNVPITYNGEQAVLQLIQPTNE